MEAPLSHKSGVWHYVSRPPARSPIAKILGIWTDVKAPAIRLLSAGSY